MALITCTFCQHQMAMSSDFPGVTIGCPNCGCTTKVTKSKEQDEEYQLFSQLTKPRPAAFIPRIVRHPVKMG